MEVVVKNQNKTHQQHGNQVNIPESTLSVRSNGNSADAGGGGNVADGARSPFQREVREWQRIDPNTGALLTGRLEADRWINGPQNSYGKISDSQNISQPDGTQHTQRKQLEVLQARTSRGAMQVIRTQTVQKTSSRWSSSKSASACASASASATSSPILTKAHNALPSISSSHHSTNSVHHSHFHKPFQLADPWPPTLNICEVDHIDDDDVTVSTDAHAVVEHADESDIDDSAIDQHYYLQNKDSDSSGSKSHSSHLFKHHSLNIYNNTHNGTNSNHSLLLDTAPSIKLSNLMKSSSSISSNNSSSNITPVKTIRSASTTTNSYKSASKISLHAIVGNNSGTSTDIKASNIRKLPTALSVAPIIPASSTTGIPPARTTPWQQLQPEKRTVNRLLEQPAFYGNSSNSSNDSSTKSQSPSPRVGGNEDDEYIVVATRVTDHGEVIPRTNTFGTNSFVNTPHRQIGGSIKSRANVRLTPTQPNRQQQQRQDLESFRYGKIANNDNVHDDDIEYDDDDDEDEDEDLRTLTTRNQRHQLNPVRQSITTTLHRSRSISTDDLSTEWDANDDTTEASGEWRRVSKLRRSFQSTSKSGTSGPRHPLDLPPFSVNVSKIRAEIENGRRLNTAMRNNHVDLAALNTILNKSSELKPIPAKRTTFLTAESLKEIRGKLKKLSDESLYKDDFIVHKHPAEINEQIKVQEVKDISERRFRQFTPDQSPEHVLPNTTFHFVTKEQPIAIDTQRSALNSKDTKHTNSLESRQKLKDTSTAEWHMRRKSYGFEKMSPPADKSIFRMDTSTDSGLGRSGELGHWSPTETMPLVRSTVGHFSELGSADNNNNVQKRYRQIRPPKDVQDEELKRHSIAVDESEYMRDNLRKTSQVNLNGFTYDIVNDTGAKSLQTVRSDTFEAVHTSLSSSSASLLQRSQQKRVEFCKTEVHFAAESGRINIVETDGKPPPTNNFRRRRRTTSSALATNVGAVNAIANVSNNNGNINSNTLGLPMTHFGDDQRRKSNITNTVSYRGTLVDPIPDVLEPTNVTISNPNHFEIFNLTESSRNSYASTSGIDTTDGENDEISNIRDDIIDSTDGEGGGPFGVHLKPISNTIMPTATVRNSLSNVASTTVAERVRLAEKRQDPILPAVPAYNNYSTKINLSLGDSPDDWNETGVPTIGIIQSRPSAQEYLLHDLREHQRMLDEGLKSTSLIIKTMRSASEFDEAMRRLRIASMQTAAMTPIVVPTPMVRSKSYQEPTRRYSTTLLENSSTEVTRSTSFGSTSSWSTTSERRYSMESCSSDLQHLPTSRPKLLGNTKIPVSQQLSQLRHLYDMAATQEDDSTDEEVKSYFRGNSENSDSGGGTQESSSLDDERIIEYSNSWNRVKAKRTLWKIEPDNLEQQSILEKKELPKSNVMNIELHSPQDGLEAKTADVLKTKKTTPIAKPRTTQSERQIKNSYPINSTKVHIPIPSQKKTEPIKEPLKIIKETRGARKLREHELSYFGVQSEKVNANNIHITKVQTTTPTVANNSKRTLQHKKLDDHKFDYPTALNEQKHPTKWHLLNDKPDLLRHSPIVVEPQLITRTAEIYPNFRNQKNTQKVTKPISTPKSTSPVLIDQEIEHFYENTTNELTPVFKVKQLNPTSSYDRKTDLKRDAMILNEMTKNADQTMKALSDEAAIKDERRRSVQRRHTKPLETIDEKTITEKLNDKCIVVKVSRSTLSSEAKRISSRHSTPSPTTRVRTSSQSSTESGPRSGSISSDMEYDSRTKGKHSSSTIHKKTTKIVSNSRSNSLDSQRSVQNSSAEELSHGRGHVSSKSKRHSHGTHTKEKHSTESTEHKKEDHHHQQLSRSYGDRQRSGNSTHSTRRERSNCKDMKCQHHHLQTLLHSAHASSHNERKRRDEHSSESRHDRHEHERIGSGVTRPTPIGQQTKPERGEKEKLTRSRGHSSKAASNERHSQTPTSSSSSSKRELERKHERDVERELKRSSSKHRSITTNGTHDSNAKYVSESNLKKKTELECIIVTNETTVPATSTESLLVTLSSPNTLTLTSTKAETEKSDQIKTVITATSTAIRTHTHETQPPILPPPRKKRQRSLIPIPVRESPTYEYKVATKIIPPTYSNQSTLRKSSLQRNSARIALIQARKPSLKHTHSTSSSFAFLPYLPAKRNSDVSHIYDNYLLYATPATIVGKSRPYTQNLVNDHVGLFGSASRRPRATVGASSSKAFRVRTTRSSVSTHHPFGICTCS
ncbi:mucin-4 isoform X2 [Teleopsis dalmanni]|uniref:mucin-4 isoform X2 n=1 Tax=Teleopsis dalmanni TaxID=139649 RepID=UPI0018CF15C7|nr:mucin-4 isoform X2 [Teleopsis dalmanni]